MNIKKRFLFIAVIVFVLGMTIAIAAPNIPPKPQTVTYVMDNSGVLSEETKKSIQTIGRQLDNACKAQVVVVVVPTLGEYTPEEYGNALFRSWGLGDKKLNNGVLLLIATNDRRSRIEIGYGLEGALPDGLTKQLSQKHLVPHLKNNDYNAGILSLYRELVRHSADEYDVLDKITALNIAPDEKTAAKNINVKIEPNTYIVDLSQQISIDDQNAIRAMGESFTAQTGVRGVFVVIPSGDVPYIKKQAERLFRKEKQQNEALAKGFVAVLSLENKQIWVAGDIEARYKPSKTDWASDQDKSLSAQVVKEYEEGLFRTAQAYGLNEKIYKEKTLNNYMQEFFLLWLLALFVAWIMSFFVSRFVGDLRDAFSGSRGGGGGGSYRDNDSYSSSSSSSSSSSDYGGGSSGGGGSSDRW